MGLRRLLLCTALAVMWTAPAAAASRPLPPQGVY